MTLDEKIGQLVQYSAGFATGPAASNLTYDELVAKGQVGSMLNVVGAEKTNHYQHIAMEKSRLHIPTSLWARRDPWPPNHVSHSAGRGGKLGSRGRRDGCAHGRGRSTRRRHRLGLLAHGRYRARSALGAHRRVERRRPLSQFGDGARLGQGLSAGRSFQARIPLPRA